jgi:hypothetical protein
MHFLYGAGLACAFPDQCFSQPFFRGLGTREGGVGLMRAAFVCAQGNAGSHKDAMFPCFFHRDPCGSVPLIE